MSRFTVSLMVAMGTMVTLRGMIACGPIAGGGSGGAATTGRSTGGGATTGPSTGTGGAGTTGGTGGAQDAGTGPAPECPPEIEQPCMRYSLLLLGSPTTDPALRDRYIAKFGDACYLTASDAFVCYYKKLKDACDNAKLIAEAYDPTKPSPKKDGLCMPTSSAGLYSLQIGLDVASLTYISYQAAPLQTDYTDLGGGNMQQVSGPYRALTDPDPVDVAAGNDFDINSGVSNGDGGFLDQRGYILQVNKNANGGKVRSDLFGYPFAYELADGGVMMVTEQEFLDEADTLFGTNPNVHHVVPRKDKRCCPWGTNSYKNAAVISRKLNEVLSNDNPTPLEVQKLNGE